MVNHYLLILSGFISKIGTFMILFGLLYFLIKYTICKLLLLNKHIVINKFYLDDIISILASLLIILNFFTIYSPFPYI